MASEALADALKGLSVVDIEAVMKATKQRAAFAHQFCGDVDAMFIERTIIEYADDLKGGRQLDQEGLITVGLNDRNYAEQYLSPREQK